MRRPLLKCNGVTFELEIGIIQPQCERAFAKGAYAFTRPFSLCGCTTQACWRSSDSSLHWGAVCCSGNACARAVRHRRCCCASVRVRVLRPRRCSCCSLLKRFDQYILDIGVPTFAFHTCASAPCPLRQRPLRHHHRKAPPRAPPEGRPTELLQEVDLPAHHRKAPPEELSQPPEQSGS